MIKTSEIAARLQLVTNGEEWTNFENFEYGKIVYEYDKLTEETCDIIAECRTSDLSYFIAETPEMIRALLSRLELATKALENIVSGEGPIIWKDKHLAPIYREIATSALEQIKE